MKKYFLITITLFTIALRAYSGVIAVIGIYHGNNIFVTNPFSSDGVGFCVQEVRINNKVANIEIAQNVFEVDFKEAGFNIGDSVCVKITHKEGCLPEILNQEVLSRDINYAIKKPISKYCFIRGKFIDSESQTIIPWVTTIITTKEGVTTGVGKSDFKKGTYLMVARYGEAYQLSFEPETYDISGHQTATYYAKKVVLDLRNIPTDGSFDFTQEINMEFTMEPNKDASMDALYSQYAVGKLTYNHETKKLAWDEDYANAIKQATSILIKQLQKQQEVEQLEIQKKNQDLVLQHQQLVALSKTKELELLNQSKIIEDSKLFAQTSELEKGKILAEKNTKELELANKEKEIKETEVQQQKLVRNFFIGGFVLVLALVFFVFRSYRQKKLANIEITHQKMLIEEKNKDILDSIHYAKRIQTSLMPTEKYIDKSLGRMQKNKSPENF